MRDLGSRPPRRRRAARQGERGQVLPLFAGGLIALLVFVGLVIDTGVAFKERRSAQNTSDLAAMAGTRVIANWYLDAASTLKGKDVYDAITGSASVNGCEAPCTWTAEYVRPNGSHTTAPLGAVVQGGSIPATTQGVRVTTTRTPGTYFVRVIGQDHWDVATEATALTSRLGNPPAGVLLPLAVFDSDYQTGQTYTLTAGEEGPGNFGWLNWGPGLPFNDPDLRHSVCTADNPSFDFPAWFNGSTGAKNDSTMRGCLDEYIANQTVVYIPIWRQVTDPHGVHLQYEISGVAAFVLTGYTNPGIKTVTGRFVEFYSFPGVAAGFSGPPCSATTDSNCDQRTNFIGLVQ